MNKALPPLHLGSVLLAEGAERAQAVAPATQVTLTACGAGFLDVRAVAAAAATWSRARRAIFWLIASYYFGVAMQADVTNAATAMTALSKALECTSSHIRYAHADLWRASFLAVAR